MSWNTILGGVLCACAFVPFCATFDKRESSYRFCWFVPAFAHAIANNLVEMDAAATKTHTIFAFAYICIWMVLNIIDFKRR